MEGTIRPWYRSRLFWLGVPGIVFLVWVWLAFLRHSYSACWDTKDRQWFLGWGDSSFAFGNHYYLEPSRGRGRGFDLFSDALRDEDETVYFPAAIFYEDSSVGDTRTRALWLSNWLAIALYSITWVGWVIWRERRKSRRIASRVHLDR